MDYYVWKEKENLSDSSIFEYHLPQPVPNHESGKSDEYEYDSEAEELAKKAKEKKDTKKAKEKKDTKKAKEKKGENDEAIQKGKKRERPANDESIQPAKKKKQEEKTSIESTYFNYMDMDPKDGQIESVARKTINHGTSKYHIPLRFHYKKNGEKYIRVPDKVGIPGKEVWIEYRKNFNREKFEATIDQATIDTATSDTAATIENQIMEDPTKFILIDLVKKDLTVIATELNKAVKNGLFDDPVPFIDCYHANNTKELLVVSGSSGSYKKTGEYKK